MILTVKIVVLQPSEFLSDIYKDEVELLKQSIKQRSRNVVFD